MLKLDLGQLERRGRLVIDEDVLPDDPFWQGGEVRLRGPLEVHLEAQLAGTDILIRGRFKGATEVECRRCLEAVAVAVDEPVTFVFRPGLSQVEAEREEVYAIPPRARELDLTDAMREHVMLAVPRFAICREACRGLCPRCGANLNERDCACEVAESDDRWAPLRKLKLD